MPDLSILAKHCLWRDWQLSERISQLDYRRCRRRRLPECVWPHPRCGQLPSSSQGLREHSSRVRVAGAEADVDVSSTATCRASLTVFSAVVLASSTFCCIAVSCVSEGRRRFSLLWLVVPGLSPELRRLASLAWLWILLFLSCSEVRSVQWFRGLAPD